MDHENLVRENFFKFFLDILWITNMFQVIRAINRTDSRLIWTRIYQDIDHVSKAPENPPPVYLFARYILLQMDRESVQLIALITWNMFLIHIISKKN